MDYKQLVNDFLPPKSKIDFIKLAIPRILITETGKTEAISFVTAFEKAHKRDGFKIAKKWHERWFTIHDPTKSELQFLIDRYHETRVEKLEIATDFFLRDGSNDPKKLRALHTWLKLSLYPQRHPRMKSKSRYKRKYYDPLDRKIKPETALLTKSGNKTIYWRNPSAYEQVRLYIKIKDNGKPIPQHCVRLEVTLLTGGCQRAFVDYIGLIPSFLERLRSYLTPFLCVAKGIKPSLKRTRSTDAFKLERLTREAEKERARVERGWQQYGVAWAVQNQRLVIADTDTNRLIGRSLKNLRESLLTLREPEKVAGFDLWKAGIIEMYQEDWKKSDLSL